MSDELDQFRARAINALDGLNARIDQGKADALARQMQETADRGVKRARSAVRGVRVAIASVVTLAAASASIWDLANLTRALGANPVWGIVAGSALDLSWVYLILQVYGYRDVPAKALKPYTRTTWLLVLSAVLNALSGVLSGSAGIGMVVLGVVSMLMPLLVKAILTPLVLGDSLTGELLVTRTGRARVAGAAQDRHGRVLAAFDSVFRLDSERDEFTAEAELQRQRAQFEIQREAIALEMQLAREQMTRAAYSAIGAMADDPPRPVTAPARRDQDQNQDQDNGNNGSDGNNDQDVPVTAGMLTAIPGGRSAENMRDMNGMSSQVSDMSAGHGEDKNIRGEATREIRRLISDGVTDTGQITRILGAEGIRVPDASYVRKLVRQSRQDNPQDAPRDPFGKATPYM